MARTALSRDVPPATPATAITDVSRLPRGRHKLAREEVVHSQRERLMRALAEVTAEKGYVETSVADVLARAHVSRKTFYQQFSSKQDCFIAAYDMAAATVLARAEAATGPAASRLERFDRALGAYLDALAAEPALARLFQLEVYAAGEGVLRTRAEVQRRFTKAVAAELGARNEDEWFACETLVAAIGAMVTERLAARDIEGLRALHKPLIGLVRQALGAQASVPA